MKVFFTSDTHFGHSNIIQYCNRPFCDVDEMDETLIVNWNAVVSPGDLVYHMGDFAFAKTPDEINFYLGFLNGQVHLVKGNHDHSKTLKGAKFASVNDVRMVSVNDRDIFLSHYAHRVWSKSHYGTWHLYGHSHGTLPDDPCSLSCDVGVDVRNMRPVSFEEVEALMSAKAFVPQDHHD